MNKIILKKSYVVDKNTRCENDCNNCPLQGFEFCDCIMFGRSILSVIEDVKKANEFIKIFEITEVENE